MASPLRFRRSPRRWNAAAVRSELYESLDAALGATAGTPWFKPPQGYDARRFDMDNGDTALFAWRPDDPEAYWLGNTETPSALWRTDKHDFDTTTFGISRWAQREFLAELFEAEPWFREYRYLAWFFLPVLSAKDGRERARSFFRDGAAGFPTTDRSAALTFYNRFLKTGVFENDRYEMASKLGTSPSPDSVRMRAAMSEFTVASLLTDAGYTVTPEIEVSTGHSLDFRVDGPGETVLAEVTRPLPPGERSASTAPTAVRETVETKTDGQLNSHGGGAVLFVDCSSFSTRQWDALADARPRIDHRPTVIFRVSLDSGPDPSISAFSEGRVPIEVPGTQIPA